MKLSIGEKIMVLRSRKRMQKQELGNQAFGNLIAPNVKIKKIEQGTQIPSQKDIQAIAKTLGVPIADIVGDNDVYIEPLVLEVAPSLRYYIGMMNDAARMNRPKFIKTVIEEMCSDGQLTNACNPGGSSDTGKTKTSQD